MKNKEIIQKAIDSANTLAAAGKLSPAQSDRFIDYVFDETTLAKMARTVRFRNDQMEIDKIGVGGRVAMPKDEGSDPGLRRGVTTSKVTLTPKTIIVPFEITDEFREHNIEGDGGEDHVIKLMATQVGNDMEELDLHGNTTGLLTTADVIRPNADSTKVLRDNYLALFDGMLVQSEDGNVVDFQGDAISSSIFARLLRALPSKYKRNKADLRFFCSVEMEELWREKMASRATTKGDQALESQTALTPFGVPLVPLPLLDENPRSVYVDTFPGADGSITLPDAPVASVDFIIHDEDTSSTVPATPFVEDTDYSVDLNTGVITHISAGDIDETKPIRVGYSALPKIVLTHKNNLIIAIGRDIRIEKDRNIYRGTDEFAITAKIDFKYENDEAVALGKGINNVI